MRFLARSLFLLTLLVTGAANAWSADGRILNFEGDVRVNGKPVTADTVLNREDTIVTAAGASVKIVLSDNSVLDIDSDSTIKLSNFNYDPGAPKENKSDIGVVEGTLRYVSGRIAKDDPNNISFTAGNSTIGVRGSFTGIDVDGGTVNVQSMIGEATLKRKNTKGQQDAVVVPPGMTTVTDPTTGKLVVTTSTTSNAVNEVVQAIAAAAPDASNRLPNDEGCSRGDRPLRNTAAPVEDPEAAAAIKAKLAALSPGELLMVMAVLINNAGHLCIDASTVSNTIATIATVRPEVVPEVVAVAQVLDPAHADDFKDSANSVPPPTQPPPVKPVDVPIITEPPPGGNPGEVPSPE